VGTCRYFVKFNVTELLLIMRRRFFDMPLVCFTGNRLACGTCRVVAMDALPVHWRRKIGRGEGGRLAPRVWADHGGEHAAPAAHHQDKDNTEI